MNMKIILFVLCLGLSLPVGAQEKHIEKDTLIPCRENIYEDNQYEGYIQKDNLIKDWFNLYDKHGKKKGTWKRDNLIKDRWNFEKSGDIED